MVKNIDGTLRFCIDFRKLNDVTVKDAHPLPRIDGTLEALKGAKIFLTLDFKSGYWQVPIKEEHKSKTAFITSAGQLYEFNRLPFQLCNAPAKFCRLMDNVLSGFQRRIATRPKVPREHSRDKASCQCDPSLILFRVSGGIIGDSLKGFPRSPLP